MDNEKKHTLKIISPVIIFVLLMWLTELAKVFFGISLVKFGILPGEMKGLIGIIAAPLIHGGFNHLISNTLPILLLGSGLFYFYRTSSFRISIFIYLLSGILIWLFARHAYHIGASGLIYGLSAFLFFSGVIRKDSRSIAIALIVVFLYGGMVWGILPVKNEISWESHLFGGTTGIAAAIIFRKYDPQKKYDWEDEEDDTPVNKLEINYRKDFPPD